MSNKSAAGFSGWRIDLIGVGACVLVTGLVYLVVIRPVIQMQEENTRLLPLLSEREGALRIARASLADLMKDLEDTRAQAQALPLRLESSIQVNSRLARLADLASQAGLELYEMQPKQVRVGERYNTVPISLSGEGDYRKVTAFMRDVHENFADIAVVDFDLSSNGPTGGEALFGIGLSWYTMPALGFVEN
jgi:Tfp pilus assembly protein PilO